MEEKKKKKKRKRIPANGAVNFKEKEESDGLLLTLK